MGLVFILAGLALALTPVPVIAPHVGIAGGLACFGVATRFFWKAYAEAQPIVAGAPPPKFNWGLDVPIGVALVLYGALWLGIGIWSLRAERALELDPEASLA